MKPLLCLPSIDTLFRKRNLKHKPSHLTLTFAELEREWRGSWQRQLLSTLLEKHILPNQDLNIDSALCLGLGSFSTRKPIPWDLARRPSSCQDTVSVIHSEVENDSSKEECEDEGVSGNPSMGADGEPRNTSLYQLLLFEHVLTSLRSRFKIPYSLFQDPEFTVADRAFLEERGHTVIAYMGRTSDPNITFPPDPSVLDRISHQTFFFAPHLDIPVAANVMVTSKPSLYWGHDMFLDRACPYFIHPKSSGYPLRDAYAVLARSYGFVHAPLWGRSSEHYGFMYPVDNSDPKTARKLQRRIIRGAKEEKAMAWLTEMPPRSGLSRFACGYC